MRNRSRGSFSYTIPSPKTRTTLCQGTFSDAANGLHPLLLAGKVESISDLSVPQFKKCSAQGQVFVNPMERTIESKVSSTTPTSEWWTGTCPTGSVKRVDYDYQIPSGLSLPAYLSSGDTESMKTEAYTKAIAGINQPDVMGLVDIAEARKTISGLANVVSRFGGVVRALRASDKYRRFLKERKLADDWRNFSSFMSQHWLEYRYMFLPLIFSCRGTIQALGQNPRPERETSRSRVQSSVSDSVTSSWVAYNSSWQVRLVSSRSTQVTVRAGALYEHVRAKCLTRSFGVEMQDIPSALWELTHWSFVVDWFLNVGDLIAAVTPSAGTRTLGSWTIVETREVITWTTESRWTGFVHPNALYSAGSTYGSTVRQTYSRVPGGDIGLTLRTFQHKLVDLIHLTDAIALIRTMIK